MDCGQANRGQEVNTTRAEVTFRSGATGQAAAGSEQCVKAQGAKRVRQRRAWAQGHASQERPQWPTQTLANTYLKTMFQI